MGLPRGLGRHLSEEGARMPRLGARTRGILTEMKLRREERGQWIMRALWMFRFEMPIQMSQSQESSCSSGIQVWGFGSGAQGYQGGF